MRKLLFTVFLMIASSPVFAAEGWTDKSALYIAGIFGVALAALGGTTAQGRAASVALEGVARNPGATDKLFMPMLLSLALIESLVILTIVTVTLVK